jgi:hypothetical protein
MNWKEGKEAVMTTFKAFFASSSLDEEKPQKS